MRRGVAGRPGNPPPREDRRRGKRTPTLCHWCPPPETPAGRRLHPLENRANALQPHFDFRPERMVDIREPVRRAWSWCERTGAEPAAFLERLFHGARRHILAKSAFALFGIHALWNSHFSQKSCCPAESDGRSEGQQFRQRFIQFVRRSTIRSIAPLSSKNSALEAALGQPRTVCSITRGLANPPKRAPGSGNHHVTHEGETRRHAAGRVGQHADVGQLFRPVRPAARWSSPSASTRRVLLHARARPRPRSTRNRTSP